MRLAAPAKLNFFLHITGRRADGYHLLESLAGFTEFGDVLELSYADELALTVEGPYAGALSGDPKENIVLRAAEVLRERAGKRPGAHIRLTKHIPVGAGLGGGSSDAAAALLGLSRLWSLALAEEELHAIAVTLGSDVPVCLRRRFAWIGGVGEEVRPVEMAGGGWVALVNPGVPLPTAEVYCVFDGPFDAPVPPREQISSLEALARLMASRRNALETPAMRLLPVIGDALASLRATEGCRIARMSGSGATCFALYEGERQARQAAETIKRAHPAWWTQAARLLDGHGQTQ